MPAIDLARVRRILEHRPRVAGLLLFLFGALQTLSFAPFGLYYLAPVTLLPVLAICLLCPPRRAARHTFWYGTGWFLCGTYWLYTSVHVFGQAPLWVAIVIMVCLVLIMAAYCAAAAYLISRFSAANAWRLLYVAPAAWVAIEWLRGWFLSGFPWLAVGYGQIDSPLAGIAPIAGVYAVSVLTVVSSSALLAVLAVRGRGRWLAAGIALLPWLAGAALRPLDWTDAGDRTLDATIVQGGVPQDRKWLPEQFRPTLDLYRDAMLGASGSELVVWPEVAIPSMLHYVEDYVELLQSDLRDEPRALLFGILERDPETDKVYNSVVLLDGHGRQVYRKRHLVPFGEYFPVPRFVRRWMRLMSLPHSDLSPGAAEQALLDIPSGDRLAVAICYEDAYGAEQLYALPEASLLINVSNDGWFGDSIAPHQHLEIARMRALEAGRYVVRATNNGVSAFIGPKGELLRTGPQFEHTVMRMSVVPLTGATPYVRAGNWPVITLLFGVLAWFAFRATPSPGR